MGESQYIIVQAPDKEYVDAVHRILKRSGIALAKKGYFHWIPFYSRRAIRRDCADKQVVLVKDLATGSYTSTFQVYKTADGNLYLRKLATDPAFEGRGIARSNFEYVEAFAREKGCPKICLDVYIRSQKVISFYERMGFVVTGTRRSIRFKELIMEKIL